MKKKKYLILSLIVIVSLFYINENHFSIDKRKQYDGFLSKKYKELTNSTLNTPEIDNMNNPEMAALQNYFMTVDPKTKKVPANSLLASFEQTQRMKDIFTISNRNDISWQQIQSDMGGRIRGIMWDPIDTGKVWACSVTGGLWYNENIEDDDSGWNLVNGFWPGLSVNCIVSDPNNPNVFYVGTGEYHTARTIYRESSGTGYGIWKSTDGGNTWNILQSTHDFKYISDIKVRNENGNSVVYAGVVSGIYKGIEHLSQPREGLYRSEDEGNSWTQVLPEIKNTHETFAPADIEIASNGRIFIGTLKNINGNGGATILWSDTGIKNSWHIFDKYEKKIKTDNQYPIPGRVILACAPSDSSIVYALIGAGWLNNNDFNFAHGRYILKSIDGGLTWQKKAIPGGNPDWASLSWHAFTISVNPVDPENVIAGGLDLWKSMNGAENWAHISDWSLMYNGGGDEYVHADQHIIAYKSGSSSKAIFSTDGGVFYSENADEQFPVFQKKNKGLSTLQFYSCDMSPDVNQNLFVGGLQDNGSLLYTGQALSIEDMITGGDGAYCFIDQEQDQYIITSVYYNRYYLFDNFEYKRFLGLYGTGVFINPGDYDKKNNILYNNACSFNGNFANNLLCTEILPDTAINTFVDLNTGLNTYFSHIKVSPSTSLSKTILFVGSQNGRLFRVSDPLTGLQTVEIGGNDFPQGNISCVAVGGSDDTLLVTFSNYGVQSVWETFDGGENWTDISGNLPDMPIRWAIYHPDNTDQVLLATELGIWHRESVNPAVWKPDNDFPNVRVDMLKYRKSDNTVLTATHGLGLFWGKWRKKTVGFSTIDNNRNVNIFPNPSSGIFNIEIDNTNAESYSFSIFDLNGKSLKQGKISGFNSKIDIREIPEGVYFIKILTKEKIYFERLIIQK